MEEKTGTPCELPTHHICFPMEEVKVSKAQIRRYEDLIENRIKVWRTATSAEM